MAMKSRFVKKKENFEIMSLLENFGSYLNTVVELGLT